MNLRRGYRSAAGLDLVSDEEHDNQEILSDQKAPQRHAAQIDGANPGAAEWTA
jgi:hypothetical protein